MRGLLKTEAAREDNPKWEEKIRRAKPLYQRGNDIRSEFGRDYTRIIYSTAYRRLKHKTQVFYSPTNDHVCTRIEHVNLVEAISYTIAKYLGLNTELTKAISVSHDLGHSPFGHHGETLISEISQKEIGEKFWHERNGLLYVDNRGLLEDDQMNKQNLNLTYAVRDGIISHCGEVDQNGLKPREDAISLSEYQYPNQYAPYTWEGCVVKIADKISYLGRDIEDAISLGILSKEKVNELANILKITKSTPFNNTIITNNLVNDLCKNTTKEEGLTLSEEAFGMMNAIKQFNYENIYKSERLKPADRYCQLVIHEIYSLLEQTYQKEDTDLALLSLANLYPLLAKSFYNWIMCYWDLTDREGTNLKNKVIYLVSESEKDYKRAILDYIAGMTDQYAMDLYESIISF